MESFHERLEDVKPLEKADRIVKLEAIRTDVKDFSEDADRHVRTVKVSIRSVLYLNFSK